MDLEAQELNERKSENYGDEAVEVVYNYIKNFGLKVKKKFSEENYSKPMLCSKTIVNGDIKIDLNQFYSWDIDVKRGMFVTKKSLQAFRGQLFIMLPKGDISEEALSDAKVVKSNTLKSYIKNIPEKDLITAVHNDLGYRFTNIKNFITLKEFCIANVKTYLRADTDYYDMTREILEMFIKVKPKNKDIEYSAMAAYEE